MASSGHKNDGMLEVDDNFGLEDSDNDNDFMPEDGNDQQVANFDDMDDNEDDDNEEDDEGYPQQMDDGQQEDSDEDPQEDYQRKNFAFNAGKEQAAKKNEDLNTK